MTAALGTRMVTACPASGVERLSYFVTQVRPAPATSDGCPSRVAPCDSADHEW